MTRPLLLPVLLAVFALAAACPKRTTLPTDLGLGDTPLDRPGDRDELRTELEIAIRESYLALSGGYEEAYLDFLARDTRLLMIDIGPGDVLVGFDATAMQLRKMFEGTRASVVSKRLEVHVSADGTSGWSHDEISYRRLHEGRRVIIPLRVTGVYERRNGRWLLVQQHLSYGVPDDELWQVARHAAPPARMGDFTAPTADAREAREVVARLALDTDDAKSEHISAGADLLIVGSDADVELRAGEAAAIGTVRGLYGYTNTISLGDLRVKASATGQIAWAAANLTVDDGQGATLPLRVTWVLERQDKVWKLVQMHVSLGISPEELSHRVFGETGL